MKQSYKYKSLTWIVLVISLFCLAIWSRGGIDLQGAALLFGLCFICELIDSGLGMGYGTILTPALLMLGYDAHDIVPTVLLSELLSGFTASFFHNEIKNVELGFWGKDFRPAAILAGGSIAGVTAGVFLALSLPKNMLNMGVGCIIFLSGAMVLLLSRRTIKYRNWKMVLLSSVASFNKAVSGGGYGPLVTSGQILSGVKTKSSVGITSFAEAFTCLLAVALFLLKGGWINLVIFIPMCAGALISVPFSVLAINKAGENFLKIVIGVLTMVMGAVTIFKALG
ncbi:MAG: sulfite exporter TauE/SafE family protein [Acidobacteria bacterium]|nr:sulfite exporter TauE/SafE family protein [Acidobacteriota bacterium]